MYTLVAQLVKFSFGCISLYIVAAHKSLCACVVYYGIPHMVWYIILIHKHKYITFRANNRHLAKRELSAIRSHCTSNDHPLDSANYSIIDKCNRRDIRVLESVCMHKTVPHSNNYQAAEKIQIMV